VSLSVRIAAALGTIALPASPAFACTTLPEGFLIEISDVVVDGVATCDVARGRCRLVAREVVKDETWRAEHRRLYHFHFEPGANERLRRAFEETHVLEMCVWPWEPGSERVEGRFYLVHEQGGLRSRQESARGGPKPGGEAPAE